MNMLNLQGDIFSIAVGAFTSPFLKQVLPALVARKCALLVFNTADLRVFESEANSLNVNRADRREFPVPIEPDRYIIAPGLKRRRQPPFGSSAVIKPRRSVSKVSSSASAPEHRPSRHVFPDRLAL